MNGLQALAYLSVLILTCLKTFRIQMEALSLHLNLKLSKLLIRDGESRSLREWVPFDKFYPIGSIQFLCVCYQGLGLTVLLMINRMIFIISLTQAVETSITVSPACNSYNDAFTRNCSEI